MTGPSDGRPGGWQPEPSDPEPSESGGPASGGSGSQRRQLPPELDPRRPVTRGSGRAGGAKSGAKSGSKAGATAGSGDGNGGPPGGGGGKTRFARIRSWSRRKLLAVTAGVTAAVVLIVVGLSSLFLHHILNEINRINPFCNSCHRPSGGAVGDLNILVLGSDSRAGLTPAQEKQLHVGHDAGQRSDTMILLHIPKGGGHPVLVSLPRDSYVKIPAHVSNGHQVPAEMNKLNAAYSEGGAKLTIETVEANTDVRIDHYVAIDFLGFVKMVDALGGVSICTPTAIHDPVHRDPATGGFVGSGLNLSPGTHTLNGDQSLEFVRAREFDPAQGDLGRIKRQQQFMGALLRKAESASTLLNPIKLDHFLSSVAKSLTTDEGLGVAQIKRLIGALHSVSPKNVTLLTVPLSNTALATPVGSAVEWDKHKAHKLFKDFTDDTAITNVIGKKTKLTVAPSSIDLTVLNATATNGLAAKAATALSGVGFTIAKTADAPKGSDPNHTVVLYGANRADSAKTVAAAVSGASTREDDSLGSGIELLVGSNFGAVHSVKVSSSSSSDTSPTTAAQNVCSS